jgi:phage terminase large subunit
MPKFYPTQVRFLNSKARYTLFGGAKAGGKSFSARYLGILLALKYKGIQILILRRTFGELYSNFVVPMRKILNVYAENKEDRIAEYKSDRKEFIFPNSSRILLGMADNEKEVGKHQGQSYDVVIFDEAALIPEQYHEDIIISNRLSGNIPEELGFEPRAYYTANPGGIGHQWVKQKFIDNPECNKPNSEHVFIPSNVYDNEFYMENDPDYIKKLEALPEKKRRALLYGDWDAFEGQFFEEFDRDIHVIDPFPIPKDWRIYRTRDYGLDMLACYWIALDYENNAYVFRELYESGLIVSEAGKKINDMTTEKIYMDIAPPDLYNRNAQTGKSAADIFYEESGHYLTKGNNDRVNGWLAVKEWLAMVQDQQGGEHPKLRIFKSCPNLIQTLPLLIYDTKNPNDVATEPHEITHGPDSLRYFCASWSSAPNKSPVEKNEDWITESLRKNALREAKAGKGDYMIW